MTINIAFRGIRHSDMLEREIRARIEKLTRYYDPIIGCSVIVELAQRHHEHGNRFHVRIDLTVPGTEIAVAHDGSLYATAKDLAREELSYRSEPAPEHQHASVAIHEAFDALRRRLQDYARRRRGNVKTRASATSS